MKTPSFIATAAAVLVIASPGFAITAGNEPDAITGATVGASVSASEQADESNSLREGVITNVGNGRDQIMVNGSWLIVDDKTTRIFRRGIEVNRSVLEAGQKLRFTLVSGKTLGVVYVP